VTFPFPLQWLKDRDQPKDKFPFLNISFWFIKLIFKNFHFELEIKSHIRLWNIPNNLPGQQIPAIYLTFSWKFKYMMTYFTLSSTKCDNFMGKRQVISIAFVHKRKYCMSVYQWTFLFPLYCWELSPFGKKW
jgi:hypothetical protein